MGDYFLQPFPVQVTVVLFDPEPEVVVLVKLLPLPLDVVLGHEPPVTPYTNAPTIPPLQFVEVLPMTFFPPFFLYLFVLKVLNCYYSSINNKKVKSSYPQL